MNNTILLIEHSPDYAKLVASWIAAGSKSDLDSAEAPLVLQHADTLEAGLRQVAHAGVDLILLDLNLPDSSGFRTFEVTKANARGIPIIVLSEGDADATTLQTIHKGAEDYLIKSKCGPELFYRVVESAIVRHKARESKKTSRVIGVLGAAGGAGVTTLACTFAAELRMQTKERVLLADLSLHMGLVSFMAGLTNPTTFSIRDAVDNLHRLDQSCWESMVQRGPGDLHIAPSPDLMGAEDLPVAAISQVLDRIKPFYQWIVLDLGRLNVSSMELLESVNDVLVVTTTAVPSIYGAILVVNALKGAGFEEKRLSLIVNQSAKKKPLSEKEMDQLFGIQIAGWLAAVPHEMEEACQQKGLPDVNGVFRKQVAILARQVAGLPAPVLKKGFWPVQWLLQLFRRKSIAMENECQANP